MPKGTKWYEELRLEYFENLLSSAGSATIPDVLDADLTWETAKVSGQVASQNSGLPSFQGTSDNPSGCLPSDLKRPLGSDLEGTFADVNERWMMSLIAAWRGRRPSLHQQLTHGWPRHLQWRHWWGWHKGAPSLKPMATRVVSLATVADPGGGIGGTCTPPFGNFIT